MSTLDKVTQQSQEAWKVQTQFSFTNQTKEFIIPAALARGSVEIPLGFQPLGIVSQVISKDVTRVAVADYFAPAICLVNISHQPNGDLAFKVRWIGGVEHPEFRQKHNSTCRMFPDVPKPSGANRLETVNFWDKDGLAYNRNGERRLWLIRPTAGLDDPGLKWSLAEKTVFLPPMSDEWVSVVSVLVDGEDIFTIETDLKCKKWALMRYRRKGENIRHISHISYNQPWLYGIGRQNRGSSCWIITAFQSEEKKRGLYCDCQLVVSGIWGAGVCFLADGSALISQYGQDHSGPFRGQPGKLIYLPASMLT